MTRGITKVAVSMGWIYGRLGRGIAGRIHESGPRVMDVVRGVKKSIAAGNEYRSKATLGQYIGDTILGANPRTHYKDLSEPTRKSLRDMAAAYSTLFPKSAK